MAGVAGVTGAEGDTEPTGADVAVGTDAGADTAAGRALGAALTGAGAGAESGVEGADEATGAGATAGATGAARPEAASLGAEAAGSACSGGNTWIGGGGSTESVDAGCCMTAAKPNAATNKAMMNHKEFLDLGLSSPSRAEFVDF